MKKILFVIIILICLATTSESKDIEISLNFNLTYSESTWKSGLQGNPTGTLKDWTILYGLQLQGLYDLGKGWKATGEFSYRMGEFEFKNWQQDGKTKPEYYSFLIGMTKDFNFMSIYGLIGYTYYRPNGELTEFSPYRPHGSKNNFGNMDLFTYKVGGYKLFKIHDNFLNTGYPIKIGPEISLVGYIPAPEYKMCRNIKESPIQPQVSIRAQW